MKIEKLVQHWEPELPLLCCPKCGAEFTLESGQLRCQGGHCYDLSAKGYVNLAPNHDQKEKYDAALFEARSRIFADGFYRPVLDTVAGMLTRRFGERSFTLADVGCGEGYYCAELARRFPSSAFFAGVVEPGTASSAPPEPGSLLDGGRSEASSVLSCQRHGRGAGYC